MAFRGQSEIHSRLLQDLGNELTAENFEKLKNYCKGIDYGKFGAGQLEKIKTLSDLFQKLQQKAVFKEGDYRKLKALLKSCENENAVEIVINAEKELFQAGHLVVGYPYPGSDEAGQKHLASHDSQMQNPSPYLQQPVGPFHPGYHQSNFPQHYPGSGGYPAMVPQHVPAELFHKSDASPSMSRRPTFQSGGYYGQQTSPMQVTPPEQIPNLNSNQSYDHGNAQRMNDKEYYKRGKGYILFINNYFNQSRGMRAGVGGTVNYEYREGAEKDTTHVKELCDSYLQNQELEVREEVRKTQFWEILNTVKEKLMRGDYSSFMLIISSHGKQEEKESIVMVDEETVTLDKIKFQFNGENAPFLVGKPKVFIIQACRGDAIGKGVPDKADCSGGGQAQNLNESSLSQLSRPENADVLEAYATSSGTKSWRNSSEGTWYINHLCKAIRENSQGDHFLDLLLTVHGQIASRETSNPQERAKQMPCYVTTFTKKFRLI